METELSKVRNGKLLVINDYTFSNKKHVFKRNGFGMIEKLSKCVNGNYRVQSRLTAREFVSVVNMIHRQNADVLNQLV